MEESKKTSEIPEIPEKSTKKKPKAVRPQPGTVHLAGIPCMNGKSKPVVDVSYSYNRANVTCEECLAAKR